MDNPAQLLHPQILGTEDLRNYLKKRALVVPNIDNLDRSELLEIFQRFAVPKAQRGTKFRGKPLAAQSHVTLLPSTNRPENITHAPKKKHRRIEALTGSTTGSPSIGGRQTEEMDIVRITEDCQQINLVMAENARKRPMSSATGCPDVDKTKRKLIQWP